MLFTRDMKELVELFVKHGVDYVLVGGFAVNLYGYVRMTQDIDFLIYPSAENALRTMKALDEFGFGGAGIPREYFEKPGSAIHLGVEPNRIDLLTHLKGVSNDDIFANRQEAVLEGTRLYVIALDDLLKAKRQSERPRDLADADELAKTLNRE
jgi:predicted nucleotidyltransferase